MLIQSVWTWPDCILIKTSSISTSIYYVNLHKQSTHRFPLRPAIVKKSAHPCSRTGIPNLSLNMYAFSIWTDEHVPQKFLSMAHISFFPNILSWQIIDIFNKKLLMIFENNIHWYMHKIFGNNQDINIFFPSIANLKCTPSDRQMHP